ncbi:adp-ribosylation factor 4b-related [Anaeramoeba flamelloides]|uniref:Adp-ribosylation factor 4b-related n=1 Tax=Anaeramoeba flamelloides TaxID=1746091 RepID=A0ABQ8XFV4_9EUKA|nr:adp-ribosylation factor 4b-related [Anaeramoeba flamelloides]
MGNWISKALSGIVNTKKDCKILILGLDAAGKTTLLYNLKLGKVISTIPTIGFNVENLEYKNLNFTCWDIGGQEKIRQLWRYYYQNSDALIYLIDSNDRDEKRINEAHDELWKMLGEDELNGIPVLIYANKQDLPRSMDAIEISKQLNLSTIRDRKWYIQPCTAITGEGIYEGLEWLNNVITSKN